MTTRSIINKDSYAGIQADWEEFIIQESKKPYFKDLEKYINSESDTHIILPVSSLIFEAFKKTRLEDVRIVILGQDPYQNEGLPMGLSFSVPKGQKIPPSLRNIYNELESDSTLNFKRPLHGDLSEWADRGILMINAALTVTKGSAGSHLKKGWLHFTKEVIRKINHTKKNVVFLSWGTFSHDLTSEVDTSRHFVIKTSHPSFFSKNKQGKNFRAFSGSYCFSEANKWLTTKTGKSIEWHLSN